MPQMQDPARPVLIGRIVKAHGIRGEVVVAATGDDPARLRPGATVQSGGAEAAARTVETCRWTGGSWIARLDGCDDRNAAEALVGTSLFVAAGALPPLPDGEYYRFQLEGLRVTASDGSEVGRLTGVIELPGQDLFEVAGPGGTLMVPGRREFIEWIDLEKGELRLKDRADLLEAQRVAPGTRRTKLGE